MGYAVIPLPSPRNFLKKKTRKVQRPYVDKQKLQTEPRAPLPPSKVQKINKEDKTEEKNFRKENILKAVRAVPKQPVPKIADTKDGHKLLLEPSGLQPHHIFRKGFGKTPKYIKDRLKVIEERDKEVRELLNKKKAPLRYVTEDERMLMLKGLKKNWDELQKEFQLLPMVTDTVPKIKRKTNLEKRLKELEKDIDLIERNPLIYVSAEE
uniref:Enkurin domain-containing protein n=1 Tax=Clastoptera arizonana TaxID=38151 RepID=A0A1B6E8Q5_9HEMI